MNVSDPANPVQLGSFGAPLLDPLWELRTSYPVGDGLLYVAQQTFGLHAVDVSNKSAPAQLAFFPTAGGCANGIYVDVEKSILYVTINAGPAGDGLYVFDISDRAAFTQIGLCPTPVWFTCYDIQVINARYLGLVDYDSFSIIDVSDPTNPFVASNCAVSGSPGRFHVNGDYCYAACGNQSFSIIDITDLLNPVEVFFTWGVHNVGYARDCWADDTYAYVAADLGFPRRGRLTVFDITNPTNPPLVSMTDYPSGAGNVNFYRIAVQEEYAYIAAGDEGLYILDISDPANPSLTGSFPTPSLAGCVSETTSLPPGAVTLGPFLLDMLSWTPQGGSPPGGPGGLASGGADSGGPEVLMIPYEYRVFSGETEDEYPAAFQAFPFMCRMLLCTVKENPAKLVLTYDSIDQPPEQVLDIAAPCFIMGYGARGFKIKSAAPGSSARYQILALR